MSKKKERLKGIKIVYEDKDVLLIDKPAGLLSVATDKEKEKTVYFILTDYIRKGNYRSKNRIYIVHRLDQQTSGLMIFAKSEKSQQTLRDNWSDCQKTYAAVVHGELKETSGSIKNRLLENKALKVYVSPEKDKGIACHSEYKVIEYKNVHSLLEVKLISGGYKHQIRVHLADLGHPVVGDKRYGSKDKQPRMALHAKEFSFAQPHSGKKLSFKSEIPEALSKLV